MLLEEANMNNMKLLRSAMLTAVLLLFVGYIFILEVPDLNYLEAGILYLAGVVGAGLFWIGANLRK